MPLPKAIKVKKISPVLVFAAIVVSFSISQNVFAAGPRLMNVNPQGTVTNPQVKITLDTEDLAKCRYSTSDTGYESMGGSMETPDGLYHSADLGTLAKKSYTYYVRCLDFDNSANNESTVVSFTVGDVGCMGDNCGTTNPPVGNAPVLSGFSPSGTIYSPNVTLTVSTDKAADCRCSRTDRSYDAMTWSFTSNDRLSHVRYTTMPAGGYYTYYIKCKDDSGNINSTSGTINFFYSAPYVAPPTPSDTTPPSISSLAPSGEVDVSTTTLSCSTDEAATCKYGTADADYDSLSDTMTAGSDKTSHSASVNLASPGSYTYYVRCADKTGNKDTVSSTISFTYVLPIKEGPEISNLQPSGAIYQKDVALILSTDRAADCRYSLSDDDYDSMPDNFETNDGTLHQATVSLETYGPYTYYVRCADKEGNKDTRSEVINFEYENPTPEEIVTEPELATTTSPVDCTGSGYKMGEKDGGCDYTQDCVCDPDCPAAASAKDHDKDCDNVTTKTTDNNSWLVVLIIGLLLLVIIVIIIVIIRRRSTEEDVELP